MEQGSPEWIAARLGKVTASRVADVVARTKSGYGASRANYMAELVAERLTGAAADRYVNAAMQWGLDHEGEARAAYEFHRELEVTAVGFVPHPVMPMSGASPDGLVGLTGLVEIKCPNTATHIETLLGAPIADSYVKQMQWQIACTGRAWADWCSYDPRLPPALRLVVRRLERDGALIDSLAVEVGKFLDELEVMVERLTKLAA
jgi:putative phage-type endonuclease